MIRVTEHSGLVIIETDAATIRVSELGESHAVQVTARVNTDFQILGRGGRSLKPLSTLAFIAPAGWMVDDSTATGEFEAVDVDE